MDHQIRSSDVCLKTMSVIISAAFLIRNWSTCANHSSRCRKQSSLTCSVLCLFFSDEIILEKSALSVLPDRVPEGTSAVFRSVYRCTLREVALSDSFLFLAPVCLI